MNFKLLLHAENRLYIFHICLDTLKSGDEIQLFVDNIAIYLAGKMEIRDYFLSAMEPVVMLYDDITAKKLPISTEIDISAGI